MIDNLRGILQNQLNLTNIPIPHGAEWVEIFIIAFFVYHLLSWIKNTRAMSFLKGIVVIAVFILIAAIFNMNTILWLVQNAIGIIATALIVILQPELRAALEVIGKKNWFASIFPFENARLLEEGRFSDRTINEVVRACAEMGRAKTGALIVIEDVDSLDEYIRTGIDVDAIVSSQLLINIFEHNTPLHDGAIIMRGNRILSATCYLPLSDNMQLSKELGTRHRAGVGISEITDSLTIIVSEETGQISVAYRGGLERGITADRLKVRLQEIQNKPTEEKRRLHWKGRSKNEE